LAFGNSTQWTCVMGYDSFESADQASKPYQHEYYTKLVSVPWLMPNCLRSYYLSKYMLQPKVEIYEESEVMPFRST